MARDRGRGRRVVGQVIDTRRLVALEYQGRHVAAAEAHPAADEAGVAVPAPAARELDRIPGVVPADQADVRARDDAPDLLGDRGEHLGGRRSPSDQRRDSLQRGLLAGHALQFYPRLRVRDRRRGQLRERGEPLLGLGRQGLGPRPRRDHHAPQPPLDHDRAPDAHLNAGPPEGIGDRPRRAGQADGPGRQASAQHRNRDALARHREPPPDREVRPGIAPAAHDGRAIVGLVPKHRGDVRLPQLRHLLGHRGEDLIRGGRLGHERRDPAQRILLARQPLELLARSAFVIEDAEHPHRHRRHARHPAQQAGFLARQRIRSRDDQRRAGRMLQPSRYRRGRADAGYVQRRARSARPHPLELVHGDAAAGVADSRDEFSPAYDRGDVGVQCPGDPLDRRACGIRLLLGGRNGRDELGELLRRPREGVHLRPSARLPAEIALSLTASHYGPGLRYDQSCRHACASAIGGTAGAAVSVTSSPRWRSAASAR